MGANRDLFAVQKDGTEFPAEVGLNPIQTRDGLLVLSVIVDISERKRIDRLKEEFISTVSHELRRYRPCCVFSVVPSTPDCPKQRSA